MMNPIDQNLPTLGSHPTRFDPDLLDPAYPDMQHWAKAGVQNGIAPTPEASVTLDSASTVAHIQSSIDAVSASGGGCVLLQPGHYILDQPLFLKSGVILRGPYVDSVKLEIRMRGTFPGWNSNRIPLIESAIRMDQIQNAGLEHLTIVFDESTPRIKNVRHLADPFSDRIYSEQDDLFVNSIWMYRSQNCFVQFCRIIDSGSNPLVIRECAHITVRYCEIHGAHMQAGGQAYLRLAGSRSCLLAGLVIQDIRHLSIMDGSAEHPCHYNVVIDCDLQVDINFHSGDSGHNLVQDCRITTPSWHWWGPFAIGVNGTHLPPGPDNLIYRCQAQRLRLATLPRQTVADDPQTVYSLRDSFDNTQPLISAVGPEPSHQTLYPVLT
jgi:hypothetical protein